MSPLLLSLTPPHPFFSSSSNPRQVFRRSPSSTRPLLLLSPAPSSSFLFAPNQGKLMPTASHLLCHYPSCCSCCCPIISAEEAANYIWRLHQPAPPAPTTLRSQTDDRWTLTSHVSQNLLAKPTRRLWPWTASVSRTTLRSRTMHSGNAGCAHTLTHACVTWSVDILAQARCCPQWVRECREDETGRQLGWEGSWEGQTPVGKPQAGRHTTAAAYLLNVGFERLSAPFIETRFKKQTNGERRKMKSRRDYKEHNV